MGEILTKIGGSTGGMMFIGCNDKIVVLAPALKYGFIQPTELMRSVLKGNFPKNATIITSKKEVEEMFKSTFRGADFPLVEKYVVI